MRHDPLAPALLRVRAVLGLLGAHLQGMLDRARDERGQDMVEYAGVLIVVAAIVVVVASDGGSIAHWITSGVSKEINTIFNGK
ncbi:MAG: hypothetical protein WAK93_00905 [Solirubrobacteraceae bacterium]